MLKRITWFSLLIITAAGFVALSIGFFKAQQVTGGRTPTAGKTIKTENIPTKTAAAAKESNAVRIVVMGDSVAKGTGDEKGKGFSGYLKDYLKNQTTKDISVENIGIDGLKTDGLLERLQDQKLHSLIAASDMVVISIGGNDLRVLRSRGDSTKEAGFGNLEGIYLNNLKELLKGVRKSSTDTYIVFVGLYNPYLDAAASYEDTQLVSTWNYDTQRLIEADPKAIFIPTYDIFKFSLNRFIASDGLHPNSLGYQAISNRIAKSVENVFNGE